MKHKVHVLAAILLAALLASAGASAETLTCIVADNQYVNVRKQASSTAATWGSLHAGDTIEVNPAETQNGFFKTTFKEHTAYVSVRYFEVEVNREYVVAANGRVRTRKSPGGEAVGFIKPDETAYVLAWRYDGDGGKWARCTGGRYISAEYLTLTE